MRRSSLAAVLSTTLLCACGSEAPTIWDLELDRTSFPVGQTSTFTGVFKTKDYELDIASGILMITAPDGTELSKTPPLPLIPQDLDGDDSTFGYVYFEHQIAPTMSGVHTFTCWVIDVPGNVSNQLSETLRVE